MARPMPGRPGCQRGVRVDQLGGAGPAQPGEYERCRQAGALSGQGQGLGQQLVRTVDEAASDRVRMKSCGGQQQDHQRRRRDGVRRRRRQPPHPDGERSDQDRSNRRHDEQWRRTANGISRATTAWRPGRWRLTRRPGRRPPPPSPTAYGRGALEPWRSRTRRRSSRHPGVPGLDQFVGRAGGHDGQARVDRHAHRLGHHRDHDHPVEAAAQGGDHRQTVEVELPGDHDQGGAAAVAPEAAPAALSRDPAGSG